MTEQFRDFNQEELSTEFNSSEKRRLATMALFFISLGALVSMGITVDNTEEVARKLELMGIAISAITTYFSAPAWVGARDRTNDIIQEAKQRNLVITGRVIREIVTTQEAA